MTMNKTARTAGILFFISTASYLIGNGLLGPVLKQNDLLASLQAGDANMLPGFFLELVNAAAVVAIAMLLYPILKKHNEVFALGYFGFRLLEAILLIISAAVPLLLIALSGSYGSASASDQGYMVTTADLLVQSYSVFFQIGMVVLALGSFLLCVVLYRFRLIPRLLSIFGFIGYASLLTSSCLSLIGRDAGALLYIPGAVFEIAFPLWLIFKGVNMEGRNARDRRKSDREPLTAVKGTDFGSSQ
ncbi:DUF4386 domain-containing protein [Saccharibacillus kuerlensis]|uniref:DUF4386 domain-containing protein n=1 Tax=Saccharibacillus kuerlensis TaxID=459527 RepID=A0ABQ2KYW2_9BACL|nr:DUF4386 domain-containing protein [Saccharibacillus kuerlensis]GGN94817.1 hypothetical protein GCM10010969_09900 [Saccharibacillus kuerlensis]